MNYDDPDDGRPSMVEISHARHRARTPKTCSDCGEEIRAGESYWRGVYKIDGVMQVSTSHSPGGECAYYGTDAAISEAEFDEWYAAEALDS